MARWTLSVSGTLRGSHRQQDADVFGLSARMTAGQCVYPNKGSGRRAHDFLHGHLLRIVRSQTEKLPPLDCSHLPRMIAERHDDPTALLELAVQACAGLDDLTDRVLKMLGVPSAR